MKKYHKASRKQIGRLSGITVRARGFDHRALLQIDGLGAIKQAC